MLCSNCSNPVKPIAVVDIDGTLGDYHGHFCRFAQVYLNMPVAEPYAEFSYGGDGPFKDWFCAEFEVDVKTFRDIKLAYRQGAQKRSMPIYDNASLMVQGFKKAGAEIWVATTRPYLRMDNIDPDTRWWLAQNRIKYDGIIYDENKYEKLASIIDADRVAAVVEDLPEKVEEAEREFGWETVLWRRTQWNRRLGAGGYYDLTTIQHEGINKIEAWKADNE